MGEVQKGVISRTPTLPVPPVDMAPSGPRTGTLFVPPDDVSQTIKSVLMQLPLGESPVEENFVPPSDSPSQLPVSPSNPPSPSEAPD